MSMIFGLAGMTASDYQFARQADNALLYTATQQYLQQANEAFMAATSLFIEETTETVKERYLLGMTGRMQRKSSQNKAKTVRRSGSWDVAYPLEEFGDDIVVTRVDFGYMTPEMYQLHVDGVLMRGHAAIRHEVLYRLFNNTQTTFDDPLKGALTIEPLANGDSVVYPPVLGSDTEATDNHYLESGYAATAISDTNNPIVTAVDELTEHYDRHTGGVPTVSLINKAQKKQISALTSFVPYTPNAIQAGVDTDKVLLPNRTIPGEIIGYTDSSWIAVWDWIPANYIVTLGLDIPPPLKMRVDPVATGLADRGVVSMTGDETRFPLTLNEWTVRFGIGAGNRLNGVVMELGTGGTYSIPSGYS